MVAVAVQEVATFERPEELKVGLLCLTLVEAGEFVADLHQVAAPSVAWVEELAHLPWLRYLVEALLFADRQSQEV